jgi:hypothetical protein
VVLHLGAFSRPDIQLFDAAGRPTGRVLWDKGRIAGAGWISGEELLVVDERGHAHRFGARGERSGAGPPFSLGAACEAEGVASVAVFADGVVALTPSGRLWCVPDAAAPRAQPLPDPCPPGGDDVHCMLPVPPALSSSGALEVLVAVGSTVVAVGPDRAEATAVFEGPLLAMALSADGRPVAGYSADGVVHIWTADLADTVARVAVADTSNDMEENLGEGACAEAGGAPPAGPPDAMAWCGSDGVVLWWARVGALLVTPAGVARWWDLGAAPAAALASEVDGVRVVTAGAHALLRAVPPPLASVLEMGSTSPGALLYDARRLYEARDARAAAELLDVLRGGDLPAAVSACLGAAAAELDPGKQEALMRAGCYGRAFLALHEGGDAAVNGGGGARGLGRRDVVAAARKLRVLNSLRDEGVALPLTMPQLDALGTPALAARLTGRRHYLLALRVCQALGASPEEVLVRWACDRIAASAGSAPDEELMRVLRSKLDGQAGVKWARVAAHARAAGRPALAASLLEFEACAGEQVPLLMELGEEERALGGAVASGDGDLVFEVVTAWWRRLGRGGGGGGGGAEARRFWAAVGAHPFAAALLAKSFASGDPELLLSMWEALGREGAAAEVHLRSAAAAAAAGAPEAGVQRELSLAKDWLARAERAGRDDRFEAAAAAAAGRLRELQAELEAGGGRQGLVGLSAVETVRQCLRLGMKDAAQRVAREFKVPERQQMLVAVQAAAAAQDWAALGAVASRLDRRAPITVEHVVAAARAAGAPVPIVRGLADRITGENALARRAQVYAEVGLQRDAAALLEAAELQGAGAGVLGSLREAVGGAMGRVSQSR